MLPFRPDLRCERTKWWMAAALALVLGVFLWRTVWPHSRFSVGRALPPGKLSPQLAVGGERAVLLAPDGSLWTWGLAIMASGGRTNTETPVQLGSDTDWRQVAMDRFNDTLAIKSDGSLWGWGGNGLGSYRSLSPVLRFTGSPRPARIGTNADWAEIRLGEGHALGLRADGSLWAWGRNFFGQVGDGSTNDPQTNVTQITTARDWKSIAAGYDCSFALKQNGTVWGWGEDPLDESWYPGRGHGIMSPHQVDPGSNWIAIASDSSSLVALRSDGTLHLYSRPLPEDQNGKPVPGAGAGGPSRGFRQLEPGHDWRSIYGLEDGFLAVRRDGSCWVIGGSRLGMLGLRGTSSERMNSLRPCALEPWALGGGYSTIVLLAKDGTLWSWGERLGWDATSWSRVVQIEDRVLGDRFSPEGLNRWAFQTLSVDRVPRRIWELPPGIRASLSRSARPSGTNSSRYPNPSSH